jgi:hypothetical protein
MRACMRRLGQSQTVCLINFDHVGRRFGATIVFLPSADMAQAPTKYELAIARANVSRILNEWKRHNLVSRLSGYYCLENKARLKAEAEL